ncbi:GNAT superfamily N-acetyltransferase [Paenibacillus phyllosphaerae]|uniref:GNAT superfamily N-acetyltransferase n=1 Tax=Paenibacillus phyllosphaerae TaxID=274593 RepID=A0A7W5B4U0_9BACL|nr:GNAT family N-acetyltransferase [Paenibacillus phyllosphaerae]MBB3114383.1 GNAT superfamily N-acetyltransferase [Paenibacillus phyllosphaerae]
MKEYSLTLEPSSIDKLPVERDILNSDIYFNQVSKDKDELSDEEIRKELEEAATIGAERYLIKDGDSYIGVLDFLMNNPRDNCTWLGLLQIKKSEQSRGLGLAAFRLFCEMMRERGVTSFRLGAIVENEPARRFWEQRGCKPVKNATLPDGKAIVVYEKDLKED